MRKHPRCKSCLLISCFFTVNLAVSAQEKGFYKGIINKSIKLDFSQIDAKAEYPVNKKDTSKVPSSDMMKDSSFHISVDLLENGEPNTFLKGDSVYKISPILMKSFTNEKPYIQSEGPIQLKFTHGSSQMVARPNYKGRKGYDFSNPPKSGKQKKKEKALEYITKIVYPTD